MKKKREKSDDDDSLLWLRVITAAGGESCGRNTAEVKVRASHDVVMLFQRRFPRAKSGSSGQHDVVLRDRNGGEGKAEPCEAAYTLRR